MTTPLLVAIRNQTSLEEIQELINVQLDINEVEMCFGLTILMAAIIYHPKVIPLLMTHPQLDVNKKERDGKTALFFAALEGVDLSPFLAHPKIDVNARDDWGGDTALHCAICENKPSAIHQLLADIRTDLSLKNNRGHTAVDMATKWTPELLPLFKREIMTLVSPKVVPRLGGTSVTRLPTEIGLQLNKMLYM